MKRTAPVRTHCRAWRLAFGTVLSLVIGPLATLTFAQDLNTTLREKNCFTCHAWDKKLVGPAYNNVRARYSASDVPQLVNKVLNGGSGAWGAVPMPANRSNVSTSEAFFLVEGILRGASGGPSPSPPAYSQPSRNSATKSFGGGS